MKKQMVVRTFPSYYTNAFTALKKALSDGYKVVMCNTFVVSGDGAVTGNEYILEKEENKGE